jgi:hypothetical protein
VFLPVTVVVTPGCARIKVKAGFGGDGNQARLARAAIPGGIIAGLAPWLAPDLHRRQYISMSRV